MEKAQLKKRFSQPRTDKKSEAKRISLSSILTGTSLLLATGAILFSVIIFYKQPKLASFDLKGTTDSFLQQLQQVDLSDDARAKTVKRFEVALGQVIKDYESQNILILVKPAVVSSIPDKTTEIKNKLAQKMKQAE